MKPIEKPIRCLCCGKGLIDDWFDICDICGWEHDNIQCYEHDYAGGANKMSLNEAREAYKNGKEIE
ncbi:MAG: CPCC family cysteine-rich protein [Paraclostridium sp.]